MAMILTILLFTLLQLAQVDELFTSPSTFVKGYETLVSMSPEANSNKEKAEILWRLSRACLLMGEQAQGNAEKREWYAKGIEYSLQGMETDPGCEQCYMWHSANVGRDCQTRSIKDQAAAVPAMMNDMETILVKLGKTECSEAWQALSEIYVNHPFKSTDSGINFARKAAMSVPADQLRLSTYAYFAGLLQKRGWSADKRRAQIEKNAKELGGKKNTIEKTSLLDGSLGAAYKPAWADYSLAEMSDAQEAQALLKWAKERYRSAKSPTPIDREDYKKL